MEVVIWVCVTVIAFVCAYVYVAYSPLPPFGESGWNHFLGCRWPRTNLNMVVRCQYSISDVFDIDSKVRIKTILPFL